MTENSRKVFEFLKKNPQKEFTKYEIVEELDVSMAIVSGSINGLIKKGLADERIEKFDSLHMNAKPVEIRWVKLNEKGLAFDPDEEERKLARARAEATALRKQARALAKAERAQRNAVL